MRFALSVGVSALVVTSRMHANWTGMKDLLNNVEFYHLFNNAESPASVIESFCYIIYACINQLVPCKRIATSILRCSTLNIRVVYTKTDEKWLLLGLFIVPLWNKRITSCTQECCRQMKNCH
jgi:hypothetical protein